MRDDLLGIELKKGYVAIENGPSRSYGGNQNWLDNRFLQRGGCGLVAAADLILYLEGREKISRQDYIPFLLKIRRSFPLLGPTGTNGLFLAWDLNRCFRKRKLPYRARWGVRPSRLRRTAEEMLSQDIPVIFSIGPDFPLAFKAHKAALYAKNPEGRMFRTAYARRHYMMMTGLGGDWMHLSSWGREYYMKWSEFEELASKYSRILTNILRVVRK